MRFENVMLSSSLPVGSQSVEAPPRHIGFFQHLGSCQPAAATFFPEVTGESEVSQICSAILAAKGAWFVGVRHGEIVAPAVLKQMSRKASILVATRHRHSQSARADVLGLIRGIVTTDDMNLASADQTFAGAMSFPPHIHQSVLRLVSETPELSWRDLIGRLSEIFVVRVVPSHARTAVGGGSFARSKVVSTFRKETNERGKDKLRDEINFLNKLPEALRALYPAVLSTEEPDPQTLVMNQEFVAWPTVRAHLLHEGTDPAEIIERLRALLHTLKRVSYDVGTQSAPSDYIDRIHFRRVGQRIDLTCELCPSFRKLVEAREIVLNGETYMNIPAILESFDGTGGLRPLVTPLEVSPYAHGDLHFENILFDSRSPDAKLVDPRGYEFCDIYYDLGKLSHSVNGKYDLIHEDLFALDYKVVNGTVEANLQFTNDRTVRIYDTIRTHLRVWCTELTNDDHSLGRMLFNEGMHFAADMPFHLAQDGIENRAVAIYLTGVKLLNQFRREWL